MSTRGVSLAGADIPAWMIESLDRQAKQIGVTRQSIIKVWLAERIQQERRAANA